MKTKTETIEKTSRHTLSVRIGDEDLKKLKVISTIRNESVGNVVGIIISKYIKEHEEKYGTVKVEF